ncbi:GHKL domain-containing protein [Paludicola sp. MB14-C6]|uniref:sensor histidine kinase n=1 Tax=Paludihabitans sp. MB14-C6 TaxID=3070656 RepID=UPI0027DAD283|nr:sensor histidine kinase [Paludicola sp. MB14-C6]WMJ22352.1 GHKL domain-containing protein [Paludicola sp. MB14-C6]
MNEIVDFFFELLINLLEFLVIIDFVSNFLGYKYVGITRLIGFLVGVGVNFTYITVINSVTPFEGMGGLISLMLVILYCIVFTKGSLLSKIFISATTFITILVINMVVLTLVSYITNLDIVSLMSEASSARYVTVIITKILFFFITRIILFFKDKDNYSLSRFEWIALISIILISIIISTFVVEIIIKNPNLKTGNIFVLLTSFGIVTIDILTYYLLLKLSRDNNDRIKYIMLEQEYKYQKKHFDEVKELYNDISKARHDLKNHFTCIMGMIELDEKQHALDYIQQIMEDKINIGPKYVETNNQAANIILNNKLAICKELSIDTKCFINGNLSAVSEIDICILLGNILDNAIEASKLCESPKITIDIRGNNDSLQILVGNTIVNSVLKVNSMFKTNKKEKRHHGYGVQNIKGIVSKYNGTIDYYEQEDMIYCNIII